jgi:outer membrane receptor protein involved in Fe transport
VNYNNYAMKLQEHPWHKPALDVKFSANYNLGDKILLNTDVFYTGNRFARLAGDQSEISELPGFADINLGLEYRYNRILSGFLRLNNISNSKYHRWNNYPVQGISVMAGFTYSL